MRCHDLTLWGYLIGDLQTMIHYLIPWWNIQFSFGHHPSTVTMLSAGSATMLVRRSKFRGLGRLSEKVEPLYRNSYRYRKCHIYETVKLNQIERKLSCGESDKRFKAFTEHGLDWTLIAQSYFLWQPANAWWAQQLYVRPSQREKQIIVWLCVNSVYQSTVSKSCFYPGRTPRRK